MGESHINKNNRRYCDSERDRDDRLWNRPSSYQSSSLDWHKRHQRTNSSHKTFHHNRGNYSWRNQQHYQRQKALQALQILGNNKWSQSNVPNINAPFPTFNIFDKNNSSVSNESNFNEIPPNRAVNINNTVQHHSPLNQISDESVQQKNDKSEKVNKSSTAENINSIEKEIANSAHIKTEIEIVNTITELHDIKNSIVTENNDNIIQNCPESEASLSLIPLSLLLKEESNDLVLEKHFKELKEKFEKSSTNYQGVQLKSAEPIQSTSQAQDPEQLSQKLVNRVITMDRVSIKHVINNPDPKFDAALKLQARKRLREEIRKQLRQMNLSTACEGNSGIIFEPDQFVDSEQIPEEVINKIRKTFGIQFLEEAGITTASSDQNVKVKEKEILPDVVGEAESIQKNNNNDQSLEKNGEKLKPDLMTRLKNFESIKSKRIKNCEKSADKNNARILKPSPSEEVLAINSSSESSEDSESSDSDSDSSSSSCSSDSSNHSSQKNRKKKKALEENVVSSFKSLILPRLTTLQRQRFDKSSSNGILESLTYIYDICLNKIGKKIILGNYEKRILKKNLKSSNNEEALQFLIKNIKELFEEDKKKRRDATKKANSRKNATKAKKQPSKTLQNNKNKLPQKLSEENQQILFNAANEIPGMKPSNDNHPSDQNRGAHPQQEYINKERVPTESKNAQSAVGETYSQQPSSIEGSNSNRSAGEIGIDCNKTFGSIVDSLCVEKSFSPPINNNEKSDSLCNDDTSPLNEYLNFTNIERPPTSFQNNNNYNTPISISSDSPENTENEFRPRSWKSPGEKKCLQPLLQGTRSSTEEDTTQLEHNQSNVESLPSNFLSDINISSTFNINQSENLRILSLMQQNKMSEAVLNNLKEIDLKLMELHKRKMYIEEMILRLQKDKMAIDLNTMQLQNERFLIISTAAAQTKLTDPSTSLLFLPQSVKSEQFETLKPSIKNKKKKTSESRPPFSTPFAKKLRNRKKRCQRDILLEDTANTLCNDNAALTNFIRQSSPEEIYENVDDIFQRKKRKITKKVTPGATHSIGGKCCSSTSSQNETSIGENKESVEIDTMSRDRSSSEIIAKIPNEYDQNDQSLFEVDEDQARKDISLECVNNSDIPNGIFEGFKMSITQIRITGEFLIAASEDGLVYKFSWKTKKLLSKFTKHTEAVTQILIDGNKYVYTTSLDGYMKKTSVENFGQEVQSVNVQEPLQTIELQWNIAYIGSRWGNVFTYNIKKNKLADTLLCSVGSSIMALKATKEGARRILIVSSKGNQINLRDVTSGLLLRTIEVPPNVNIYSILLNENLLYCGSSKNEIFIYNFTTGNRKSVLLCGNGVVSIKFFRRKYIFAGCYDGFVYVLDKMTGSQIGRFPGCGKIILAMDIIGEKLLTTSKDKTMELMDIPKYILALDK